MDSTELTAGNLASAEATLREELARGDAMLSNATPILCRLLASEDPTLLSDEIVARVRGMVADIARQLLEAQAAASGVSDRGAFAAQHCAGLAAALAEDAALLGHFHALAIEGHVAEQLEARIGLDPVLSPLLEELVAKDEVLAAAAMAVISAQARFVQQQRRMALPLGELPGELFQTALAAFRRVAGEGEGAQAAEAALRGEFDESRGRIGLLNRLVMRTGSNAPRALDVESAGLAIFATALASAAGQARDVALLSLSGQQLGRFALALRAAGLKQAAVEEQLFHFHPHASPPKRLESLSADRASAILAESNPLGRR